MKKLLFILLLAPSFANAQKILVGIAGGFSTMFKPSDDYFKKTEGRVSPTGMISGRYVVNSKLRLGIDITGTTLYRGNHFQSAFQDIEVNTYIAATSILATPALSFTFGGLYFGPQIGILINSGKESYKETSKEITMKLGPSSGFCGGIHAGYSYGLTNRLSTFVQASGNYVSVKSKDANLSFIQAQLLIGFSYR